MKIRNGFVSNSSSSSYTIVCTEAAYDGARAALSEVGKRIVDQFAGKSNRFTLSGKEYLNCSCVISSEDCLEEDDLELRKAHTSLKCTSAGHNKFYHAKMTEVETDKFEVTAEYGKIGHVGNLTNKTPVPLNESAATEIYEDLIKAKKKKGYVVTSESDLSCESEEVYVQEEFEKWTQILAKYPDTHIDSDGC